MIREVLYNLGVKQVIFSISCEVRILVELFPEIAYII